MNFIRQPLLWDAVDADPAALCARLNPWCWTIEAGYHPPPCHDPANFPLGDDLAGALALSLSSRTLIGLSLGPALVDRLNRFGPDPGPLAGLALHELLANAVVHGNLRVESGRSDLWSDIAQRQTALVASLADPSRAARIVTIAIGWRASQMVAVIADEGDGYDVAATRVATRASGRGLRLARMLGRVDVLSGGRQTAITMVSHLLPAGGQL